MTRGGVLYYTLYYDTPMTLTVRLKKEHERLLRQAARALGRTRSDIVREAIARYAAHCVESSGLTALERLAPWIGCVKGGARDLSVNTGEGFRRILRQRNERRPH